MLTGSRAAMTCTTRDISKAIDDCYGPTIVGFPLWSHSMTIQVKAQLEAARWVISAAMPA